MLEAKIEKAIVLKQVLDAIKELVTDVNFDCDEDGMKLQAMDNSHVALVALLLRTNGFSQFRCDRNMSLGINVVSFQKIVKSAANEDMLTLRAQDEADVLNMVFETINTDRVAEYDMKMMDIDIEHLSIPTTVYDAEVTLSASEFSRIIRDLKDLGESVRIEVTKESVKFSVEGDIGKATVTLKATEGGGNKKAKTITIEDDEEEDDTKEDEEEDNEEEEGKKVKEEEDDDEEKEDEDDEDNEGPKTKKRKIDKKKTEGKKGKNSTNGNKKSKKDQKDDDDQESQSVFIVARQSVSLTFSIKYLSNFTKATPLATKVTLHMSNEVPLLVEYDFGIGYVRYYLAPKIEDD
ncbi:hypothetical protein CROQUDRAFT_659866 [Cronartium quercuum f. sp. fusiforme G11]|uniref:DNA sliding clamp PCNA n=1 Tax=Cronartium quercuum f. sp. fusiforme G11 TaxID=708437 RepID=A0A9P6NJ72_9BASI|nr:hypothetical protein CROQUDRAFT_659866 [Cronartium quercuum f. sp. fusiforme G11]